MIPAENPTTGGFRLGYENGSEHGPVTLQWRGRQRPDWLRLRYIQNGAGLFSIGDEPYHHWFDGLALLRQFEIGAEVVYSGRFLESQDYLTSSRRQQISYTEFATVPARNLWQRVWCTVNPGAQQGHNDSVNLQPIQDELVAIGDQKGGTLVDPGSLRTPGEFDIHKFLMMTSTPHPQRDDERRGWVNLGIGATLKGFGYHVYLLRDGSHRPEPIVFIPRSRPAFLHSVAMSQRYVIVSEMPYLVSLPKMFTLGLRNKPGIDAVDWKGSEPLTLFVIDKEKRKIAARVEVPAMFYFHATNAFDDGDDVVIDLCTYPDDTVIDELYLARLRGPHGGHISPATLVRYRVHVPSSSVTHDVITDASVEFPRGNPHNDNRPYRYTYALSINPAVPNDAANQLVKVDVTNGATATWFEAGCYPGEPLMVPRPGAIEEDDGVLLCVVLDAKVPATMLLVLEARSMEEIGRAYVPVVVPFGFHGQALPAQGQGLDPANSEGW